MQPSREARRVYEHEVEYYNEPPDTGENPNIDSSIETILANKTITKYKPTNPDSLISKEAYFKLTSAARSTQNRLEVSSKALILSVHKYKAHRSTEPPYKDNKSLNIFTLAELHQLLDAQYDANDFDITRKNAEEDSTRLVNFSQANDATIGDIRKILSVLNKKSYNNNKKKAYVNKSKVSQPIVVIDGTSYRAINMSLNI